MPYIHGMNFTEKEAEKLLEVYTCPRCNQGYIKLFFSSCYDNECCGLMDRIYCSNCSFEYEGYFQELEDFIKVLLQEL